MKYDFSFMKEYSELYHVSDTKLAEIFHCGKGKVKDVLDGTIKLSESLTEDICCEQGHKNYEEYKNYINKKIESAKKPETIIVDKKTKKEEKKPLSYKDLKKEEILDILEFDKQDYNTKLILLLLFFKEKDVNEISEFILVDTLQIINIYKDSLYKINEYLNKNKPNIMNKII